jgi:hypothetical protein
MKIKKLAIPAVLSLGMFLVACGSQSLLAPVYPGNHDMVTLDASVTKRIDKQLASQGSPNTVRQVICFATGKMNNVASQGGWCDIKANGPVGPDDETIRVAISADGSTWHQTGIWLTSNAPNPPGY